MPCPLCKQILLEITGKLHFQNILNFGRILCSIQGDIENIFICFLFAKKKRLRVPDVWLNWL